MHQTFQYIKFLLKSTNQHGVHSPFVYNLVTKCFYDRTVYKDYKTITKYIKKLLKNNTKILVTDLGAGSQIMRHQERSISQMAKHAGTTLKRAKLLYRLNRYFKFEHILELGTSLGIATHALSLGYPESYIETIEGCPTVSKFTMQQFKKQHVKNISFIVDEFNDYLKSKIQNPKPTKVRLSAVEAQQTTNNKQLTTNRKPTYDLIFFDGNHQKEATLHYFESLLETIHNDSVFIFDDIYWSNGMTEAWKTIKQHPKVTVTIDTFYWGFVFFRKEQAKEHFTIRV
ncbi:O-methyltransferase [Aestuariivivens marinum]|uniref:O-methyltransferase n=1 Tax=Aestuariivivens marinum TaxID=2913555 RepID=UPI001F580E79|nr:class I SAM-dependent methyltransferase [Aestuariivivens marinum]